ncbi:hypothetical protein CHUAL_004967 [Chamberlinius hualienensis]
MIKQNLELIELFPVLVTHEAHLIKPKLIYSFCGEALGVCIAMVLLTDANLKGPANMIRSFRNMNMIRSFGFFIFLSFIFVVIESKICVTDLKVENEGTNVTNASQSNEVESNDVIKWFCPLEGNSVDQTECCSEDAVTPRCCSPERKFYQIENRLAIILASTVVSGCVVIALLVIACCFWSKCPLYNACRVRYTDVDIVAFDKNAAISAGMPDEPNGKQNNHFFVQCKKLDGENAV